jgi:hypothetical protein
MKTLQPKKIIKYAYLGLLAALLLSAVYLYIFFKNNIYDALYFDPEKYPQTGIKENMIDMAKFNDVASKIEEKRIKVNTDYIDLFK